MRVAMIGAGYVGLVSGACFADFGHDVCCVDKDPAKIDALNAGQIPIFEPGLSDLVAKSVREHRLSFTTDLTDAVRQADAVFIGVGTPSRRGDGHADLSYVYQAAREIAAALDGYTVVVTKSTVPVGTGDEVERIIRETRPEADFAVVSNPEFLREGAAPPRPAGGHAALFYGYQAAREIAAALDGYPVVGTKPPVPGGTGDEVERITREPRPEADFAVVSNPEFLREGAAIADFKRPDRVVVGADDERAREVMRMLYRPLNLNQTPIVFTSRRTSELIKYAANAFLAMKITFINETADLCEAVGADVQPVARGLGLDNRIGSKFRHPGPGSGGSALPEDPTSRSGGRLGGADCRAS